MDWNENDLNMFLCDIPGERFKLPLEIRKPIKNYQQYLSIWPPIVDPCLIDVLLETKIALVGFNFAQHIKKDMNKDDMEYLYELISYIIRYLLTSRKIASRIKKEIPILIREALNKNSLNTDQSKILYDNLLIMSAAMFVLSKRTVRNNFKDVIANEDDINTCLKQIIAGVTSKIDKLIVALNDPLSTVKKSSRAYQFGTRYANDIVRMVNSDSIDIVAKLDNFQKQLYFYWEYETRKFVDFDIMLENKKARLDTSELDTENKRIIFATIHWLVTKYQFSQKAACGTVAVLRWIAHDEKLPMVINKSQGRDIYENKENAHDDYGETLRREYLRYKQKSKSKNQ